MFFTISFAGRPGPEAEVVVLGEVRGRAAPLKFGRMDQTVRRCRVFYDK